MYATRYPCVPIDKNSGLLFWVPRSDTIHDLIKNNRTSKGFQTSLEEL